MTDPLKGKNIIAMIAALYTDFPIKYFKHKDVYLVKINITYNFYVCTYTYV